MNTLQCARHVYQTEGIRGFYRGLTASYAGISETVICFAIYESLKKYLKDAPLAPSASGTEKNSKNFFGLMAAAAVSKGCASCIAYPHGTCCFLSPSSEPAEMQVPAGSEGAEPSWVWPPVCVRARVCRLCEGQDLGVTQPPLMNPKLAVQNVGPVL